ncbi:MAG: alpha/beta hydrolase [Alphaproteobacteria bacterium]|nr:alpha/beta hydrolase [Alphaproteobacteria bacterium]
MPFYERGDVRIRYEEAGSGFPLLVTPGGGLNSRLNYWPNSVINAFEALKSDFRCITMDQRNANEGESTGPLAIDDPWGGFAEDQLGLMDHLGIDKFAYMGFCIGGCFAGSCWNRRRTGSSPPSSASRSAIGRRTRTSCTAPARKSGRRPCSRTGPTSPTRWSISTCTIFTG